MLFETQKHLQKEREFINHIEQLWDCTLFKQPINKQIDCIIYDQSDLVIGCLEMKIRNFAYKTYDTLMISSKKILAGQNWAFFAQQPFFLAVRLNDCDIVLEINPHDTWDMRLGGMTFPRVSADREPVYYIPLKEFKLLTARTV
jgi:hypothetical protein|tara:strand:+ start:873 stop:1304 length:432 start_codon:yes stop_codon:yes gene_type:complete